MLHVFTRGFIGAVGAALLSLAASVPIAAAYTDAENDYIARLQAGGINGDPNEMVRGAHMICDHTAEGASNDDMANTLREGSVMHNGASAITIDQAYGMVTTAQSTVCAPAQGDSSPVDCTQLRKAYDSLGPVIDTGDAVAKLNKLPGLSQVTGTSLGLCAIDAIPAAINNPTLENQQRVADGGCGFVSNFTSGLLNLCGDTPVGSH